MHRPIFGIRPTTAHIPISLPSIRSPDLIPIFWKHAPKEVNLLADKFLLARERFRELTPPMKVAAVALGAVAAAGSAYLLLLIRGDIGYVSHSEDTAEPVNDLIGLFNASSISQETCPLEHSIFARILPNISQPNPETCPREPSSAVRIASNITQPLFETCPKEPSGVVRIAPNISQPLLETCERVPHDAPLAVWKSIDSYQLCRPEDNPALTSVSSFVNDSNEMRFRYQPLLPERPIPEPVPAPAIEEMAPPPVAAPLVEKEVMEWKAPPFTPVQSTPQQSEEDEPPEVIQETPKNQPKQISFTYLKMALLGAALSILKTVYEKIFAGQNAAEAVAPPRDPSPVRLPPAKDPPQDNTREPKAKPKRKPSGPIYFNKNRSRWSQGVSEPEAAPAAQPEAEAQPILAPKAAVPLIPNVEAQPNRAPLVILRPQPKAKAPPNRAPLVILRPQPKAKAPPIHAPLVIPRPQPKAKFAPSPVPPPLLDAKVWPELPLRAVPSPLPKAEAWFKLPQKAVPPPQPEAEGSQDAEVVPLAQQKAEAPPVAAPATVPEAEVPSTVALAAQPEEEVTEKSGTDAHQESDGSRDPFLEESDDSWGTSFDDIPHYPQKLPSAQHDTDSQDGPRVPSPDIEEQPLLKRMPSVPRPNNRPLPSQRKPIEQGVINKPIPSVHNQILSYINPGFKLEEIDAMKAKEWFVDINDVFKEQNEALKKFKGEDEIFFEERIDKSRSSVKYLVLQFILGTEETKLLFVDNDLILYQQLRAPPDKDPSIICERIPLADWGLTRDELLAGYESFRVAKQMEAPYLTFLEINLCSNKKLSAADSSHEGSTLRQPPKGVLLHSKMNTIQPVRPVGGEAGANTQIVKVGGGALQDSLRILPAVHHDEDDSESG